MALEMTDEKVDHFEAMRIYLGEEKECPEIALVRYAKSLWPQKDDYELAMILGLAASIMAKQIDVAFFEGKGDPFALKALATELLITALPVGVEMGLTARAVDSKEPAEPLQPLNDPTLSQWIDADGNYRLFICEHRQGLCPPSVCLLPKDSVSAVRMIEQTKKYASTFMDPRPGVWTFRTVDIVACKTPAEPKEKAA